MSLWTRMLGSLGTATPQESENDRERLREQLKRDEGLRLHAYRDSEGVLTIGYGHNLDADPALRDYLARTLDCSPDDITISAESADRLLDTDIAVAEDAVRAALPWSRGLDARRCAVLFNMAFNLGIAGLLRFQRMRAALKLHDFDRAAEEMLDSRWATQVGERATRLARQMRDGEWT